MNKLTIKMTVDTVLEPYEKYGKKFYPVSVKEFQGEQGRPFVFNALTEIPQDTVVVYGDLYRYQGQFKIKNVRNTK